MDCQKSDDEGWDYFSLHDFFFTTFACAGFFLGGGGGGRGGVGGKLSPLHDFFKELFNLFSLGGGRRGFF